MKNSIAVMCCSLIVIMLITLSYCTKTNDLDKKMITKAHNPADIISLFAITIDDITSKTPLYIDEAKKIIDSIIAIPDEQRTFENTVRPLDAVCALSNVAIAQRVYEALELLSPNDAIRNAAHDASITIQAFWVDYVTSNKNLFNALTAYATKGDEQLSAQQRYALNHTIDGFKRAGLSLSDETLVLVNALRKELASLCADFDRNIAQDNRSISVTREELEGLEDDFIATLSQTANGLYILGVDYPTYFRVMENCSVASTRQKLYLAFNNRAYPVNDALLISIMEKRNEMAQLLGYIDFAHCDIDDQMAHTPERAHTFITDLAQKSSQKLQAEMTMFTQELPKSVILTKDGKIQPWDFAYIENNYKKTHFNIDEQKIAEYFPMKKTIDELLDIYHQFFSINFKEVPSNGLWHEDATIVQVYNQNDELLGTLILDLYPRPNKYNHAAHTTIIPATYVNGTRIPDVSIVLANFTRATAKQPSLLKRSEVQTFFHEFGHALHAILGATEIATLSGTHTKTDFVELPSQMLEEWLTDKEILQKVSGHYLTGQPLPDDIIDTIIQLKKLTTGYFVTRQTYLSSIALSYFGPDNNKNPHAIMKSLFTSMLPQMAYVEDNHFYTSFGHLTGYGAKYYGYLWSKVFSLDLFATIKKYGLLNPEIGQKYIKEVLSKGGAQDPNELLYNFLGREPNAQAFLEDMGI